MEAVQTIQERVSSPGTVSLVRRWLDRNRDGNRGGLTRYLCEKLGLKDALGELRIAGTQKALRQLEAKGYWKLPAPRGPGPGQWRPRRLGCAVAEPQGVAESAGGVEGLQLVEVRGEDEHLSRTWNELIDSEHPLHDSRLVGRQLRYLIGSQAGWLGAIGFGGSALRLEARDRWIGWDDASRKGYGDRVIGMTRFLIRPSVRCRNLASRVLGMCARRVRADFAARYGYEPWLMESFVDGEVNQGSCFRAANWKCVGQSKGRGRSGPKRPVTSRKDIYLYELVGGWRRRMGVAAPAEKIISLGVEESVDSEKWVEQEFGAVDLGDRRLTERLMKLAELKARAPSAMYTQLCGGNRHFLKAYYRLMGSDREQIHEAGILSGHREQTVRRMKGYRRVLVVQDSTDLNFAERLHCNGLGQIGTNQTGAVSAGLKMHSQLAVGADDGLPLGVLDTKIYAPEVSEEKGGSNRPIEEKESYRWVQTLEELAEISPLLPDTELICVGDRESDIFELFDYRRRRARGVQLLVRAQYNRRLSGSTSEKLFDRMAGEPVMATARIAVPRQREKKGKPSRLGRVALPAREAQVELRWAKVSIAAPQKPQTRGRPALELYALYVVEPSPPQGAKAIRWMLLNTVPIHSRKQALRGLRWYSRRWRIEEWHRVLKSGCRIEAHQHRSARALARAIAIDAVVGWRIMLLTLLGRQMPQLPAQVVFNRWECELLEELAGDLLSEQQIPKKGGSASAPLS